MSDAQSSTSTTTQNIDNRITSGSGDILNLANANLKISGGGTVNISSANADLARNAIASVVELASRSSEATSSAVQMLAKGSNEIAAQVAKSQEQFVATASGQKYVLWALGGIAALVLLPSMFKGSKS